MSLVNADKEEDVAEANVCFNHLLASLAKLSSESDRAVVTLRDVRMNSSIATLFAHGEAQLSVRFNDSGRAAVIDQKMRQLVKKTKCGKSRFQISGNIRRPPMVRIPEVEELYAWIRNTAKNLDIRIVEEHRWSSSDICFVNQGKHMIDGLGPIGDAPHDDEEYILRHSILDRSVLLASLLNDLRQRK